MNYSKAFKPKIFTKMTTIFVVIIAMTLIVFLSSCGQGEKKAEAALSNELERILHNESGLHLVSEVGTPISSLQGGEIQKLVMAYVSYDVNAVSPNKNGAVAQVEFSYPDLPSLAETYIEDGNDPSLFGEWLKENIGNKISYLNTTVDFFMNEVDDGWQITVPGELYEILSGGMQSYIHSQNTTAYKNMKEGALS